MQLISDENTKKKTNNGSARESKREKFVRLAEARTNKILKMIDLLGNCANKNYYDYTDEDIKKIFTAIDRELKIAKVKFSEAVNEEEGKKFSL